MVVKIQAVGFSASQKLDAFIRNKVSKLIKFDDSLIAVNVVLRVEKLGGVDNKLAEISLDIPKVDLFAKKQTDTFEESVDLALDALRKQVQKHKEKIRSK